MIPLPLALALSGCGEDPAAPGAASFLPAWGEWEARIEDTWGGDCKLADKATYQHARQRWEIGEDRYGFSVRDELGYWYSCALAGSDFVCELPVVFDDFTSLGLDVRATYTPTWEGVFTDVAALEGLYSLHAECEGSDCGLLTGYGERFEFPCTAEAGLTASFVEP